MKRYMIGVIFTLIGFAAGSLFVGSWLHGQPAGNPPPAVPRELTSYRDIVKRLLPAVIYIETHAKNQTERLGFGSGFFVDPSGVVVTNFHVVEGAEIAVVHTHDGRKFSSKNIRSDRRTDLAVILLDAKDTKFPVLELGDSEAMEIGDRVLAVGAPFGLAGSVTHGIISGKGRSGLKMNMYEDFLQTDAAINPGNSGGPLVNLEGKVVGVCAAIKSKSGGFQGVGLATSSNLAKSVVPALRTTGVVKRGYLGAHIRELDPEVADRLGLTKTGGVILAEVFDKTPAAKAGLKSGDFLIAIAGKPIKNGDILQRVVASLPIDQAVDVDVLRVGKSMRLTIVIEEQPADYGVGGDSPTPRSNPSLPKGVTLDSLGIDVADLTAEVASELGFRKATQGVVITRINDSGLAGSSSLRVGTVIGKIDKTFITSPAAAQQAMRSASLSKGIILQILTPQGGASYVLMQKPR